MEQLTPHGTGKGPAETFTGDVYVDTIVAAAPPSRMIVAAVRHAGGTDPLALPRTRPGAALHRRSRVRRNPRRHRPRAAPR